MNSKEHTMNPFYDVLVQMEQRAKDVRGYATARDNLNNLVQDRKTGEFYDPKARFDELMNKQEILASLKRLSIR
jgi:hypothetical protein